MVLFQRNYDGELTLIQVQLYIKLLNAETPIYSQILWMKLLFSLLPPSAIVPAPDSQIARALDGMMVPFLSQCILLLPRVKHVRDSGGLYQPDFDYDEVTIDTGQERYEAILGLSLSKVRAIRTSRRRFGSCLYLFSIWFALKCIERMLSLKWTRWIWLGKKLRFPSLS